MNRKLTPVELSTFYDKVIEKQDTEMSVKLLKGFEPTISDLATYVFLDGLAVQEVQEERKGMEFKRGDGGVLQVVNYVQTEIPFQPEPIDLGLFLPTEGLDIISISDKVYEIINKITTHDGLNSTLVPKSLIISLLEEFDDYLFD